MTEIDPPESAAAPDATAAEEQDPQAIAKEQMRQALEKKNQKAQAGAAHLDGHAKAAGTHGKVGGSRQFRRKSGG